MQYRTLGFSGLKISVIGLGTWAIGGGDWKFGWGDQDEQEAIDTIVRAVELGINWIDTAAIYGEGRSEVLVAKALRQIPAADRGRAVRLNGDADTDRAPCQRLRLRRRHRPTQGQRWENLCH